MSQEFEYAPDGMVVLMAELRKMIAENKPITITVPMMEFILTQCEDVTCSFESMTAFCLEQGIITRTIANQWKAAYVDLKGAANDQQTG